MRNVRTNVGSSKTRERERGREGERERGREVIITYSVELQ